MLIIIYIYVLFLFTHNFCLSVLSFVGDYFRVVYSLLHCKLTSNNFHMWFIFGGAGSDWLIVAAYSFGDR